MIDSVGGAVSSGFVVEAEMGVCPLEVGEGPVDLGLFPLRWSLVAAVLDLGTAFLLGGAGKGTTMAGVTGS